MIDHNTNITCQIQVNGKSLDENRDDNDGSLVITACQNTEFSVFVANDADHDREIAIAIDGVSIIDGCIFDNNSEGYILRAHHTMVIPGWLIDQNNSQGFVFGPNNAIINIMVYNGTIERPVAHSDQLCGSSFNHSRTYGKNKSFPLNRIEFERGELVGTYVIKVFSS